MSLDILIFLAVLFLRFAVPLAMPRFPLPSVILAMVLDAIDQTIFQTFTDLDLAGYQGYDKALDVYYLTIAYLTTMRNWTNITAFEVSRFLLYYRLVGVVLFEWTHARFLLLVFPNTFEYFFIAFQAVLLRWNSSRLTPRLVVGLAAFIWIVIKLPQEWWIHVAQLDFTEQMEKHQSIGLLLLVALIAGLIAAWWIVTRKLPPADHRLTFDAGPEPALPGMARDRFSRFKIFDSRFAEKVALVSLICIIFVQIVPGVDSGPISVTLSVALLIAANTAVSELLARRGVTWTTTARQFAAMAVINIGLTAAWEIIVPRSGGEFHAGAVLFFLLLLTLIITFFDRFHPIWVARSQPTTPDESDLNPVASAAPRPLPSA